MFYRRLILYPLELCLACNPKSITYRPYVYTDFGHQQIMCLPLIHWKTLTSKQTHLKLHCIAWKMRKNGCLIMKSLKTY